MVRYPGIPVTPYAVAPILEIAPKTAPHAPPIIPQINGFINRKFTPKIAGSVMPIKAERDAGRAMERIFLFLVLKATANAAAPCATFAAVAIGNY